MEKLIQRAMIYLFLFGVCIGSMTTLVVVYFTLI